MHNNLLIFIPTYNEAENVKIIYSLLKQTKLPESFDILFLDDNSPDKTGKILDEIVKNDNSVFVIHRKEKSGIGSAHKAGIAWAYSKGYKSLITMDCDLTHSPEYLADFYEAGKKSPIVIGSRYMEKESLSTWNLYRKSLTNLAHFLTKNFLGLPYDASGAFRFFNLEKINPKLFELTESNGYSFFFESLLIFHLNKVKIKEVPIKLPKRTYGSSKMSFKDIYMGVSFLFKMYVRKTFHSKRLILNGKKV